MSDESKLRELMDRGQRASYALNEWQEAFEATKKDLLDEFEGTRFDEEAKRERIYDSLRALNHMFKFLQQRAISGENARKELLRIKDPAKWRTIVNARR